MAENKIKSYISIFRKELNLDDNFEEVFLKLLHWDRENILIPITSCSRYSI